MATEVHRHLHEDKCQTDANSCTARVLIGPDVMAAKWTFSAIWKSTFNDMTDPSFEVTENWLSQ